MEGSAYGYMELDSWNGIMQGRFVEAKSGPRKYLGKQILEIELLQDKPDHIASFVWLAVLLNEIFCTLYPQYYHLLSVGVNQNQYRSLMRQNGIPGRLSILGQEIGLAAEHADHPYEPHNELGPGREGEGRTRDVSGKHVARDIGTGWRSVGSGRTNGRVIRFIPGYGSGFRLA